MYDESDWSRECDRLEKRLNDLVQTIKFVLSLHKMEPIARMLLKQAVEKARED